MNELEFAEKEFKLLRNISGSLEDLYHSDRKEYIKLLELWFDKTPTKVKEKVFASISFEEWGKLKGPAINICFKQKEHHPKMGCFFNLNELYQNFDNPKKMMYWINHMVERAAISQNITHQKELFEYIENALSEYPENKINSWLVGEWGKMLENCEKQIGPKLRLKIEQSIPISHQKLLASNQAVYNEAEFLKKFSDDNKIKTAEFFSFWNELDKSSVVHNKQVVEMLQSIFCFNFDLFESFIERAKKEKLSASFLKSITPHPYDNFQVSMVKDEKEKNRIIEYFAKTYPNDFIKSFNRNCYNVLYSYGYSILQATNMFKIGFAGGLTTEQMDEAVENVLLKNECADEFLCDIMKNKRSLIKDLSNPKLSPNFLSLASPKMIGTVYLLSELMGVPQNNQYPCYPINFTEVEVDEDDDVDPFYRINKKTKDNVLSQYKILSQKRTLQHAIGNPSVTKKTSKRKM